MVNKKVKEKKKKGKVPSAFLRKQEEGKDSKTASSEVVNAQTVKSKVVNGVHKNIRCRNCLITDGYLEEEQNCRYCGARLFVNG
ncbi:MAG: hypothetical protein COZ37_00420 [bacterium (Candidatus Ratteibacteria) CG_4_10_14_3_um_filter_41_18]|uniref:Uncharacterized protein n=4 Tax=Candidatus Ratteibacteria TaxID=2979319 RepID=A0A2M7YGE6_9BACT|nr:MAG: hypothetical protein AUJ76_00355 [Candidatus Omnitrophica bacterium CG1_02_41_171]PIV63903.1 MAG: hypothetical protein COS11_04960 [bacterium (Candidatus Ratteibacteria) CG01_land_8_20_14_3_00_40_19]PIW32276.1 MAG: hypothetical protein COW28_06320 [bacterium (Candidatus Ratteibacteria) CG15_BIG_FIL_POST_REV_8_21_14_020_41_12]PIW74264.1 MAG: hypothetical protein CO004_01570 [bacterium (Candidatus Ratteibacteria) CG_4_8_14_3_um_filter_41_36]PIX77871.1 MAG: hypothetical protein COZ37_00420